MIDVVSCHLLTTGDVPAIHGLWAELLDEERRQASVLLPGPRCGRGRQLVPGSDAGGPLGCRTGAPSGLLECLKAGTRSIGIPIVVLTDTRWQAKLVIHNARIRERNDHQRSHRDGARARS